MKRLLFLLLLFFIVISCTDLGKNQLQIAQSYLDTYPDSTLIYLEDIDASELNSKMYMEYLLTMTQARHKTGQAISNDTLLFAYKDQFRKFPDHKAAWFHFYIGKVYYEQGNINQALCEYMECEKLHKKDSYLSAMLQFAQAELHMNKLELEEAIRLFQSSAKQFKQINNFLNTSVCYNQIGNCYLMENRPDSIFRYYQKCLEYRKHWTPFQEVKLITNIAFGYRLMNKPDIASKYLHEALLLPVDENSQALIYYHLANLYYSKSDFFLKYIHHAIDLLTPKDSNPGLMSQLYLSLADFYTAQQDYELALQNHRWCSYYLSNSTEGKYDTTIKELRQENHIHQLKSENLRLQISRHRIIIILLIITVLCGIGIILILRKYKKHKEELLEAKVKIELLKEMAAQVGEEKASLRNVVLQHFELLRKVAVLEYTFSNNKEHKNLLKTFNQIVYQHDNINWSVLYEKMNSIYGNLFNNIQNTFPQLKESEFKICCLTIAQFSSIEIAVILNYTPKSVYVKKSQIRKKLGITSMRNIADFFNHYFQNQ
ncbi:MAG: hypothetical protein LUF85_10605 [Bacteroides sp.]|nr:hypothetical protein [Bacteroides sp.]